MRVHAEKFESAAGAAPEGIIENALTEPSDKINRQLNTYESTQKYIADWLNNSDLSYQLLKKSSLIESIQPWQN